MEKNTFVVRLKAAMERQGTPRKKLAEEAGISIAAIGNYVNGKQMPDGVIIARLAKELNVSADYLLGLSNVPDRNKDIDTINKELGFTSPAANQLFQLSPAERRFLCDLLEKADCLKDIALSYELLKKHISYEKALEAANECPEADRWRNDLEYIKFTLSRSFLKFVEKD